MRKTLIALGLLAGFAPAMAADAISSAGARLPLFGASPWGSWGQRGDVKWDGEYLSINSGMSLTSIRKGPTIGGPVLGLEAGKMWREGDWVYGASVEGFGMPAMVQSGRNAAFPIYTQQFGGLARIKSGYLVQPNLLLYGSVGVTGISESLRLPNGLTDTRFTARPDLRAGAHWVVNENVSLTVEVGVRAPVR